MVSDCKSDSFITPDCKSGVTSDKALFTILQFTKYNYSKTKLVCEKMEWNTKTQSFIF